MSVSAGGLIFVTTRCEKQCGLTIYACRLTRELRDDSVIRSGRDKMSSGYWRCV